MKAKMSFFVAQDLELLLLDIYENLYARQEKINLKNQHINEMQLNVAILSNKFLPCFNLHM